MVLRRHYLKQSDRCNLLGYNKACIDFSFKETEVTWQKDFTVTNITKQ